MTGLIKFEFEGNALAAFKFRDRSCMVAQDVGGALGYSPEGFRKSLSNWSDELVEGTDYAVLSGDDLKAFRALGDVSVKMTLSPRAPSATVLFESGLWLVCLKTERPGGRALRRRLADDVLPALAKQGGYINPNATDGQLLDISIAAMRLLRDRPGNNGTLWYPEVIAALAELYDVPTHAKTGKGFPIGLMRAAERVYTLILGKQLYALVRERTGKGAGRRKRHDALLKAAHERMGRELTIVEAFATTASSKKDFWARMSKRYAGKPLQREFGF